jgi:hypothetical protein
MHNVTLSVVAMCVRNPDCSPVGISLPIAADHLWRRSATVDSSSGEFARFVGRPGNKLHDLDSDVDS